jgi:polyisoprenoid-binding protein YceI
MEAGMVVTRGWRALVVACAFAAIPAFAADLRVVLDPAATPVHYTLADPLHTVHGAFRLLRGTIVFDPETGAASGELVVDATSGQSGSTGRDSRMHKNVLESAKYPEIVFKPDRVEGKVALDGDSEVSVHGTFRIHGADHEIMVQAKTHFAGGKVTAEIRFPIPYVKWGMKNPSNFLLHVEDTVQIEIDAAGRVEKQ